MSADIEGVLREMSLAEPESVIRFLRKGDRIRKSAGVSYIIDDAEIYKQLGEWKDGEELYKSIINYFNSEERGRLFGLCGNGEEVCFSEVLKLKRGECLEKSILFQLALQDRNLCYLVRGIVQEPNQKYGILHAYNIFFSGRKGHLVDIQNPLVDNNGGIVPFTAPITGINDSGFFIFDKGFLRSEVFGLCSG